MFLRYDANNVITKGARILLAPITEPLPDEQTDIYDDIAPYDPNGTWFDAGATSAAPTVNRNLSLNDVVIQQDDSPIRRETTSVVRTLTVPFAEISDTMMEIIEQSGLTEDNATRTKVHHGSIPDLAEYRIALAVRKGKSQGVVTEDGVTDRLRGADVLWVGYRASISADNVQLSFGRGEIAGGSIGFDLVPDPAVTVDGTETGFWLFEKAPRTIVIAP